MSVFACISKKRRLLPAGLVHAKADLQQWATISVDGVNKLGISVPQSGCWLKAFEEGTGRVETGDSAQNSISQELSGIASNVRAQRVADDVERGRSGVLRLAERLNLNGNHCADNSRVDHCLSVGEKVALWPVDEQHIDVLVVEVFVLKAVKVIINNRPI